MMPIQNSNINILFQKKHNNNINLKLLFNKIRIIGPLGILEKNIKYGLNKYKIMFISFNVAKYNFNNFLIASQFKNIFFHDLFKLLAGVLNGWFFSFNIFGRGFSFRLKNNNTDLFLKLKIGYSHFVYFKLNKEILVKISKKRNKLFLFSLNFWLLYNVAYKLRNLRSLHTYKIQGILFSNEKIKLKPGKKKQS